MTPRESLNVVAAWLERTKNKAGANSEFRGHIAAVILEADRAMERDQLNLELQNQNDFLKVLIGQLFEGMFGNKNKRANDVIHGEIREILGRLEELEVSGDQDRGGDRP